MAKEETGPRQRADSRFSSQRELNPATDKLPGYGARQAEGHQRRLDPFGVPGAEGVIDAPQWPDDTDDLHRFVTTITGCAEGYLIVAVGVGPHYNEKHKYCHQDWHETPFRWPHQRDSLLAYITRCATEGDTYLCPYPQRSRERRKYNSAMRVLIHADLDTTVDTAAIAELGGFTVCSGTPGHAHVYIPLAYPVMPAQHEALCRALARRLDGDHKYADNDLLRPPGTFNYKPALDGGVPAPVTVTWAENLTRVDPMALAEFLGADWSVPGATDGHEHTAHDRQTRPVDLDQYPGLRVALAHNTGDRSKDTWRIVRAAFDAGLDLAQARWVVHQRADLKARLDERKGGDDLAAIWDKLKTKDRARDDAEPPPDDESGPSGEQPDTEPEPSTWEPVDLGPYLAGEVEQPQPSIGMPRTDGLRLIYPGREHAIIGETESGKTWLALGCVAAELTKGNHVVYVHYEESNPASTIERLLLLGAQPEAIRDRLRFVAPAKAAQTEWVIALLDPAPTLVVHDGVNEGMALHDANIFGVDGASLFRRKLVTPFLRAGAASIACDHVPKEREGRASRDAYGSVHKGNALDGARILLENKTPFGRGMRGVSYAFITKDRPGQLRAHGHPSSLPGKTFIGTLIVDDSETSSPDFLIRLYAPKDTDDQPAENDAAADLKSIVYAVINALPDHTVASQNLLLAEIRKAGHKMQLSPASNRWTLCRLNLCRNGFRLPATCLPAMMEID